MKDEKLYFSEAIESILQVQLYLYLCRYYFQRF